MSAFPLVLGGRTTVRVGQVSSVDLGDVQTLTTNPIEITEIRVRVKTPAYVAFTVPGLPFAGAINMGLVTQFGLEIGPHRVTQQMTPLGLITPVSAAAVEIQRGLLTQNVNGINGIPAANTFASPFYYHMRWVLPQPLLLPPGWVPKPSFSLHPDYARIRNVDDGAVPPTGYEGWDAALGADPGDPVVDVAFGGRVFWGERFDYAKATPMPYVTSWVARGTSTTDGEPDSGEHDLVNGLDVPVMAQRMVGRVSAYSNGPASFSIPQVLMDADSGRFSALANGVFFSMEDSRGYRIAGPSMPWLDLFSPLRQRAWAFHRQMDPSDRVKVRTTGICQTGVPMPSSDGGRPMIGLVGYRMVKVSP